MEKVWETTFLAVRLIAAMAAGARMAPRFLSPEHIISNFESRTRDNPKLKEFLETNLNRKFFHWPAPSWEFSMLPLAARYYHPELDVARAKHITQLSHQVTAK
jgi:outer membrane protein, heavy metal efflux system